LEEVVVSFLFKVIGGTRKHIKLFYITTQLHNPEDHFDFDFDFVGKMKTNRKTG
jgi:hypothetical protein